MAYPGAIRERWSCIGWEVINFEWRAMSCAGESPSVFARARVQVGLGHVEQIEPAFAQQQSQVQRTWFRSRLTRGVERVEAGRLESRLAGLAK